MKRNVIQKRFEATTINGLRAALVVYALGVLLQAGGLVV
jgi:hypothetical protein